ncbi:MULTISPECIES: anaerobic sulfatase maturase [unclassified Lentimonas]|uniref:anaerobic sulfatase maturase n=1 Tax=unclassified Lentimonas TaxID=2630993 RepID=UPI001320C585|nr:MULTISPECIES: anaerobic sulfatase maturase [unclassified Lentimonas]CAA6689486.1 Putative arylsulfatase regulatory protein [Lentimonas sp. CC10]CAA6691999.1 Putative arylsulfatase regulatory protein [Lentimonas sp. CC19]CAA7070536.1 Putative arylsulfatase regulatory protein [Lentimonas sp. CC11]
MIPDPQTTPSATEGFHVMAKAIGPICNLDCKYCFYLEKEQFYPENEKWKMSDEKLETFIRDYIAAQPSNDVSFAFQGGEPTLLGVNYFRKVVEFQKKHANGKKIETAFQTNGTLLNDEWGEFLAENKFLVGLSIDGPEDLHNANRVDKKGGDSYKDVIRGLNVLRKHKVEFNTLTCVNSVTVQHPVRIYKFLKSIGSKYIQFIPIVEREVDTAAAKLGLDFAEPPKLTEAPATKENPRMSEFAVPAEAYGDFLIKIFNEWIKRDVGKTYVQLFDVALGKWLKTPGGLCYFAETCGRALAMEHDGDVYTCDHYVYPKYKLGNLMNTSLAQLADSPMARDFGNAKRDALPKYCRECSVKFACNGECPKHRFTWTPDGEWGLNYLCPAYKKFFNHIDPAMKIMSKLYLEKRPPADVMQIMAEQRKNKK